MLSNRRGPAPCRPTRYNARVPEGYTTVSRCRLCGNANLSPVLSLGVQALTGVFPAKPRERVTSGPVDLVRCEGGPEACGLVQLLQTYDKGEMYGGRYGYRSGLNASMVKHLQEKVASLRALVRLSAGDVVLDIGSNDGTLLSAYPAELGRVGMDPTAERFRSYYPPAAIILPEFFSSETFDRRLGGAKAKVVTSIAMFYDLDAPLEFARQVKDVLADDGVWLFEQSHLGRMIEQTSYDTVCHEHLEFYGVRQLRWILEKLGMKIVALSFNEVNGGSVSVTAAKASAPYPEAATALSAALKAEEPLRNPRTYARFREAVELQRRQTREFLDEARRDGKTVLGYGASTKGNVILQYCGITPKDLPCIGEVNQEKFGCYTPGTLIPIVPQADVLAKKPDTLFVLPWHFEEFILKRETAYRRSGGKFFFPLPRPRTC